MAATMGARIAQARREQGSSPRQVAARLGVKPATLENWEQDRSEPRANKLLTLAGVLDVPVSWLLQGDDGLGERYQSADADGIAAIRRKLERAAIMQEEAAALLAEASAAIARLDDGAGQDEDLVA